MVINNLIYFFKFDVKFLLKFLVRKMFDKKEYMRKYRQANKEKIKENVRKYQLANKERIKQYKKEYYQTEVGKKGNRISKWKTRGIIDNYNDNYETIYKLYSIQKRCSICNKLFNNEKQIDWKVVDHSHLTGKIRRICCNYCNLVIVK